MIKEGKTIATITAVLCLTGSALAGNWYDNVKLKGDLRYRHEMIKKEDMDTRQRHRIRARLAVEGEVNNEMKAVFQLATGSDDPLSTNQTLDNAFSTKSIGIDLAYFEYKPSKISNLKIKGGKFKNPFVKPGKSELIWDSDWNPEGGTFNYQTKNDNLDFTLIGAGLWIDEDSKADDVSMMAGQGVFRFHMNEKKSSIAVGGSYFYYSNMMDHAALHEVDDAKGNSSMTNPDNEEIYLNDYELLELSLEINHKFENTPVTAMFDYVTNTAVDSLETGWLIGLRVGKAKKPGSWAFRYIYREVEKDAVVGAFSDSDFRGGGADAKGHEFGGTYMLAQNTAFSLSYFMNTIGLDADADDCGRLQVDLQLKF